MTHGSSVKSAAANELLRIICFILYYMALIGIGGAILVGAFWVSYILILHVLPEARNLRSVIGLMVLVVGMCLLALMLGVYLIKPLFSFTKNTKSSRVEISESECPELYAMIRDIADKDFLEHLLSCQKESGDRLGVVRRHEHRRGEIYHCP